MANKISKVGKYLATTATVMQASALTAFAQVDDYVPDGPVNEDLITWVHRVLNVVIGLTGLIAVGYLIYSGIQYIVAAGDETKVEKATKGITYAVIGLVICFIAVLIVNFVINRVIGA